MTENHNVLLDCGQFQGGKAQERLNFDPFPFDPAEVECMILSHAHIDHCGRIPLLVKRGFRGKIYCTDQALRQAGLILGLGKNRLVGRSHFLVPRDNSGYFGQLAIVGDVSAVSAECMMVARGHFEAVRGFDEGYGDSPLNTYRNITRLVNAGAQGFTLDDGMGIRGCTRMPINGGRSQKKLKSWGSAPSVLKMREMFALCSA
jgi:hypothetical protein